MATRGKITVVSVYPSSVENFTKLCTVILLSERMCGDREM